MTNQDPNTNDASETTSAIPQRTFAQWLAQCQTITPESANNVILATVLVPGEIRWENHVLMLFDIELYDLNTQSPEDAAIQAGIENFYTTIGNSFAAAILSYSLATTPIQFI